MRQDERDSRSIAEAVVVRLRALREEHPDAQVTTELVRLDDAVAVVRAAIVLPNGGAASGFGTSAAGGLDAVEEAETRALNRALTVLGYAPVRNPSPAPPAPNEQPAAETPSATRPQAAMPAAPVREAAPSPEPIGTDPPRAALTPAAPSTSSAKPAADADDPPLADFSWTEFWKWARSVGFQNKQVVEELIGQPITSLSPAQVRVLLREKSGAE